MKIQYITQTNATDIHNWSGLNYFIAQSLKSQNIELSYIDSLKKNYPVDLVLKKIYTEYIRKQKFSLQVDKRVLSYFANQVHSQIEPNTDIIFSPSTIPLAYLETNKPKVFYVDALYDNLVGFYDTCTNISEQTYVSACEMEQAALSSSALAFFSSDWAAENAIKNYKVDAAKVKVIPFGANITENRTLVDIQNILDYKTYDTCNLLFIGVDWKRKGGDVAIELTRKLNESGIKSILHVVGSEKLPYNILPEYVINHGFISKSNAQGIKKLNDLFASSHFFVLPTKADCSPLVLCEAGSYGLPSLTTAVGGIPTIIRNDINGFASLTDKYIENSLEKINFYFGNKSAYNDLAKSSFNEFESRLNWRVAGQTMHKFLKEL